MHFSSTKDYFSTYILRSLIYIKDNNWGGQEDYKGETIPSVGILVKFWIKSVTPVHSLWERENTEYFGLVFFFSFSEDFGFLSLHTFFPALIIIIIAIY